MMRERKASVLKIQSVIASMQSVFCSMNKGMEISNWQLQQRNNFSILEHKKFPLMDGISWSYDLISLLNSTAKLVTQVKGGNLSNWEISDESPWIYPKTFFAAFETGLVAKLQVSFSLHVLKRNSNISTDMSVWSENWIVQSVNVSLFSLQCEDCRPWASELVTSLFKIQSVRDKVCILFPVEPMNRWIQWGRGNLTSELAVSVLKVGLNIWLLQYPEKIPTLLWVYTSELMALSFCCILKSLSIDTDSFSKAGQNEGMSWIKLTVEL